MNQLGRIITAISSDHRELGARVRGQADGTEFVRRGKKRKRGVREFGQKEKRMT